MLPPGVVASLEAGTPNTDNRQNTISIKAVTRGFAVLKR